MHTLRRSISDRVYRLFQGSADTAGVINWRASNAIHTITLNKVLRRKKNSAHTFWSQYIHMIELNIYLCGA